MLHPYDSITEDDTESILRFLDEYGDVRPEVPMDVLLSSWSRNKGTLFKAFGCKLKLEYDVDIQPTYPQIEQLLSKIYKPATDPFVENKGKFITSILNWQTLSPAQVFSFMNMVSYRNVYDGTVYMNHCFKLDQKEPLRIPRGTKVMRAVRKFLIYIEYDDMDLFEAWRNRISDVMTKTRIESKLVLSIHPSDFLTLSDNMSDWGTCLSWSEKAMGRCGCIEMMNSRYAVVAYLTDGKTFCGNIANKTWRTLIYVNKYILLSSKSYPFTNDEITKMALEKLRGLVYNNLKWKYQYGMERYYDGFTPIVHRSNRNQGHLRFDFITMYDDINLNEETAFYCYRNYVEDRVCGTRINSYSKVFRSQKPTCMCCGKEMYPTSMDGYVTCLKCWKKDRTHAKKRGK